MMFSVFYSVLGFVIGHVLLLQLDQQARPPSANQSLWVKGQPDTVHSWTFLLCSHEVS